MLTGGCQCGAVRYEVSQKPGRVYCCHCTECRAQSASAFGISVIVAPDSVRLTAGHTKVWRRPTAAGKILACAFCPDCGTRLWHVNEPPGPEMSIKGGSLDQPVDLTDAFHIWTDSALPGVCIPPGARRFAQEPDV
ncbi:GFA family protein [Paracoccus suum]|uniref:GFA family protein n=1 Tax=Paracoccus suum TaxID=2259340 RepID=A0A344PI80_9RHOB|nr:GFA family protein [Paracoccus suum]AXC49085.1 GFA family protein [Paracoccus suum]